jgi:Flp pilus assembly protein TadG
MKVTRMATKRAKIFLKCERGTQMIEFALLLPFLIVLFASGVEMGRLFYTYNTLQKATAVGARYLSTTIVQTDGTYLDTETAAAKNLIVCGNAVTCSGVSPIASNLSASNITITPPGTGTGTRYVTVSMNYPYQPVVFDLGHMTGASLSFTFTPSMKMRYMP